LIKKIQGKTSKEKKFMAVIFGFPTIRNRAVWIKKYDDHVCNFIIFKDSLRSILYNIIMFFLFVDNPYDPNFHLILANKKFFKNQ
jgi:hypothetical protein